MPIGSKELIVDNLDKIEDSLLVEELKKAKEELFNLRFQSATGQLESHGRLRAVKRDIARIYTIIRERELGIRAIPAVSAPAPVKVKKAEKPAVAEADAPKPKTKTKESK
jgi:large subunit ribosomal protein L29